MSNRDNAHDLDIFPDEKITKRSEPNKPSTNQEKHRKRSSNFCYTLNPWEHMRNFFKNIFWSKHCPAITDCRSQLSRVFLVKPVLKISQISQKNIHSTCQVTCNFVLKSSFTGMFFSEIYEIFRTAILRNYTFFCVSS